MKNIHLEMIESFKFLEAEKHNNILMDNMGDPIPSVSEEMFFKYFHYLTFLLRATRIDLPFNITLCPNRSIDLELTAPNYKGGLLINIKEYEISYYGYEYREVTWNGKWNDSKYFGEIKNKTTSQIPDYTLVTFVNKVFKHIDFSE